VPEAVEQVKGKKAGTKGKSKKSKVKRGRRQAGAMPDDRRARTEEGAGRNSQALRRSAELLLEPEVNQRLGGHALLACLLTDLAQQVFGDRAVDLAGG
jgi:hypothetical protein